MTHDARDNAAYEPFPLEGGRVGMGVEDAARNAVSPASSTTHISNAATPIPGPSPLQGAGNCSAPSPARPRRIVEGGTTRARRLRREETVAERILWKALRPLKMNVRRQTPVGRYIADFAHLASRLIIEVDGPHHDLPERQTRDAERTAWLNAEGFRVIRFPERQVRNDLNSVVEQIVAATAPPPSPALPPSRGKGVPRYDVR